MTKTNRSPLMRIATFMMVLCLALSCVVCGTMAKYISSTSNSDVATVAKWEFTINDLDFTEDGAQAMAFDLFKTVNDTGNAAAETDIDGQGTKKLIAPGTSGSFELVIKNLAQVNAKYTFQLTETNADGVYVQYSLDNKTWYDDFAVINETLSAAAAGIDLEMLTGEDTHTVYWRWVYEGADVANADASVEDAHVGQNDTKDTDLGVLAQTAPSTVEVKIDLVAWQVD